MKKSDFKSDEWEKLYNEVSSILSYQAKINQAISYGKLCQKTITRKLQPNDEALHDLLGEISVNEDKKGNGMLSVFCGKQDKILMPGNGFLAWQKI